MSSRNGTGKPKAAKPANNKPAKPRAAKKAKPMPLPAATDAPPVAAATSYVHVQDVPEAVWTIQHGLECQPIVSEVVDSAGTLVSGVVTHISNSKLQVTFPGAFAGRATLSKEHRHV